MNRKSVPAARLLDFSIEEENKQPNNYSNQASSEGRGGDLDGYQVITGSHARNFMVNDHRLNVHDNFSDNKVRTTKYTWWTFIPRNLFTQFSKFANLYFLALCVL